MYNLPTMYEIGHFSNKAVGKGAHSPCIIYNSGLLWAFSGKNRLNFMMKKKKKQTTCKKYNWA